MTVSDLQRDGYSIKFTHGRMFHLPTQTFFGTRHEHPAIPPSPRGGFTVCTIKLHGVRITSGVAHCSRKDNFNKKIGRDIALGRAIANMTGKTAVRAARKESENAFV